MRSRWIVYRQQPLFRVPFVAHSTKYLPSATRYSARKVVVTTPSDDDGAFAECTQWHLAKNALVGPFASSFVESSGRHPLPSASWLSTWQIRLQWAPLPVPLPSVTRDTRQIVLLCRVPGLQYSAKCWIPVVFGLLFYSLRSLKEMTQRKKLSFKYSREEIFGLLFLSLKETRYPLNIVLKYIREGRFV